MDTFFETQRLILRPFLKTDAEDVHNFNSNPEVIRYTGDIPTQTIEDAQNIISRIWHSNYDEYGYGRFAVYHKEHKKVIGFSGLKFETEIGATDIGYRFLPEYWGKGIATEATKPFFKWGFLDLCLKEIVGLAYPENVGSCKVLEKNGMTLFKKEPFPGETKDCLWYRITRNEYNKSQ